MGKQAEPGRATCRQRRASLRALPVPGAEQPWLGRASGARTSLPWAGSVWQSKTLGKGESSPPIPPVMHETRAHPKSCRCFKKLQPSSFPAQANMDLCCRLYFDALSEGRGGAKTSRAFCKLGVEQIFCPVRVRGLRKPWERRGRGCPSSPVPRSQAAPRSAGVNPLLDTQNHRITE